MADPGSLTLSLFAGRVGDAFDIHAPQDRVVKVTLAEAEALGEAPAGERTPFSIIFSGPADGILAQGIYRVEHEAIGASDVFLVPLQPNAAGARYQAVFT